MADRLPTKWAQSIIDRLAAYYGESVPGDADHWATELAALSGDADAISRGLDSLPTGMPSPSQFLALCRPTDVQARPPAQPRKRPSNDDYSGPRAWAYRLRDTEARGAKLTPAVREMWRAGINHMQTSGIDDEQGE